MRRGVRILFIKKRRLQFQTNPNTGMTQATSGMKYLGKGSTQIEHAGRQRMLVDSPSVSAGNLPEVLVPPPHQSHLHENGATEHPHLLLFIRPHDSLLNSESFHLTVGSLRRSGLGQRLPDTDDEEAIHAEPHIGQTCLKPARPFRGACFKTKQSFAHREAHSSIEAAPQYLQIIRAGPATPRNKAIKYCKATWIGDDSRAARSQRYGRFHLNFPSAACWK